MSNFFRKNEFYYLVLVLIIVGQTVLLTKENGKLKETFSQKTYYEDNYLNCKQSADSRESILKAKVHNERVLEDKKLKKGLKILDSNNNSILLDSLISLKESETLILRFSWSTCEGCQVQEMKMIQDILVDFDQVIVIASFRSVRELNVYMDNLDVALPVYCLDDTDAIFEGVDKSIDKVFAFVTDGSSGISHVHMGSSDFPNFSKNYYNFIFDKWSENKLINR